MKDNHLVAHDIEGKVKANKQAQRGVTKPRTYNFIEAGEEMEASTESKI